MNKEADDSDKPAEFAETRERRVGSRFAKRWLSGGKSDVL
jgi:hypothetical protein